MCKLNFDCNSFLASTGTEESHEKRGARAAVILEREVIAGVHKKFKERVTGGFQ